MSTDLRRALRSLMRAPMFAGLAITCLAIGIGASSAVYSLVASVLVAPLPYADPDRLVWIQNTLGRPGDGPEYLSSAETLARIDEESNTLARLGGAALVPLELAGDPGGIPERIAGARVTGALLPLLGVPALIGRPLVEADDESGEAVAAIGERLWARHFGRDPDVVGRTVELSGVPTRIVGVMPETVDVPLTTDAWIPLRANSLEPAERHLGNLLIVGRLAEGATLQRAREEAESLSRLLQRLHPDRNRDRWIQIEPLREVLVEDARPVLSTLAAAVAVLLGLACLNVMNLTLVRSERRSREMGLRAALGATGLRVARALVIESAVVVVVATATGLALAAALRPALASFSGAPGSGHADFGSGVVVAAILIGTAVTFAVAMVPAAVAFSTDLAATLGSGGRAGTPRAAVRRAQSLLIAAQAALGVALATGAALAVSRLESLTRVDPGFRVEDVVTFRIAATAARYPSHTERTGFVRAVLESVEGVPGVESVGASNVLPIGDPGANWSFSVEDLPPSDPSRFEVARGRLVTPGYFRALGIPVISGRAFDETDEQDAPPVVVVSRALADRYWPGTDAVGRRIKRRTYDSPFPWMTVVGVVDDVRDGSLDAEIGPTLYMPEAQVDSRLAQEMSVVVRAAPGVSVPSSELVRGVHRVDPQAPVFRLAPMRARLAESVQGERLTGSFTAALLLIGLTLLAAGVYGVVAAAANERVRETGIRLALGSPRRGVVTLLLGGSVGPLVAGLALGGVATAVAVAPLARWTRSDPTLVAPVVVGAVLTVLVTGILAALVPGVRAARVDPARVLSDA